MLATDELTDELRTRVRTKNSRQDGRRGLCNDCCGRPIKSLNHLMARLQTHESWIAVRREDRRAREIATYGFEPFVGEPFPFRGPCDPCRCALSVVNGAARRRDYMFGAPPIGRNF